MSTNYTEDFTTPVPARFGSSNPTTAPARTTGFGFGFGFTPRAVPAAANPTNAPVVTSAPESSASDEELNGAIGRVRINHDDDMDVDRSQEARVFEPHDDNVDHDDNDGLSALALAAPAPPTRPRQTKIDPDFGWQLPVKDAGGRIHNYSFKLPGIPAPDRARPSYMDQREVYELHCDLSDAGYTLKPEEWMQAFHQKSAAQVFHKMAGCKKRKRDAEFAIRIRNLDDLARKLEADADKASCVKPHCAFSAMGLHTVRDRYNKLVHVCVVHEKEFLTVERTAKTKAARAGLCLPQEDEDEE